MLRTALSLSTLLAASAALAQTAPAAAAPEDTDPRRNQRIERIVHEDAGTRIEEVRYAGQTQSITVQPKAAVPEYEVAPSTPSRNRIADERTGTGTGGGQRYWNVFRF